MTIDKVSPAAGGSWKGPTVAEIARAARVGTSTVDRVLNGRDSVREATRHRVLEALASLSGAPSAPRAPEGAVRRIAFITDSGVSYNRTLEEAVLAAATRNRGIEAPFTAVPTWKVDPAKLSQDIERAAADADGLVVVARENLSINRALRTVSDRGCPVVCLTTDLPNSGRIAYVGSDQACAGATAAYLMGQVTGGKPGKVLLVFSAPYRCQEEREQGFRRVLRSEFTNLEVDERLNSHDDNEQSYRTIMAYLAEHGPPAGVYNPVAGNLGIGRALAESGLGGKTVFIGHELNANSRLLMEQGLMHFAIGHDVDREVELAIEIITAALDGRPVPVAAPMRVRVYTKYSCN